MAVAEKSTFIKLDRNIQKWRWFTDGNTLKVWIWLLVNANIKDHDFLGETIHRGQVATSYPRIASDTGMTARQARTALSHLMASGEVSWLKVRNFLLISIPNYDIYQSMKSDSKSRRSRAEVTPKSRGCQQSKNVKNHYVEEGKNVCSEHTRPTRAEVVAYAESQDIRTDVDAFLQYNDARGWKGIVDWRPMLMKWAAHDTKPNPQDNDDGLDDFGRPVRKEFK